MRAYRVWFLVMPGSELLDIGGPWEVFGHANDVLGWPAYEAAVMAPGRSSVRTRHGLVVSGARPLPRSVRNPPDAVLVAGGSPLWPMPAAEARVVSWLQEWQGRIPTVISICTGAFLLGEAGVLDGHRVTTHWKFLEDLRRRFPEATVVDEGIFVRDERLWTSAGITSGIDLALALVEEHHGHNVAMAIAKKLVLFLRRSGKQAQFSAALQRQQAEPGKLRGVSTFVVEHLDERLSVRRIAEATAMSPRSLSRWCREHLNESPAEFVRRLRIDEARRLLEDTNLPLKDITSRVGLGNTSTMWRAFSHHLGVTPAAYRHRFAGARARHGRAPTASNSARSKG